MEPTAGLEEQHQQVRVRARQRVGVVRLLVRDVAGAGAGREKSICMYDFDCGVYQPMSVQCQLPARARAAVPFVCVLAAQGRR